MTAVRHVHVTNEGLVHLSNGKTHAQGWKQNENSKEDGGGCILPVKMAKMVLRIGSKTTTASQAVTKWVDEVV